MQRRVNDGALWLILVNGLSYLTTLVRERYLYQHEYGTHALDDVVVLLAALAIAGNALGIVASFWWSAGRITERALRLGVLCAAVPVGLVALVSLEGSLLLVYLVASSVFLVAIQRAASAGRQFYAVLGAVTAPVPTILIWEAVGVRSASHILLGYAAGACWQAAGAWVIGRGGSVDPSTSSASLLWPVAYIAAVQADGVADISVLLLAGRGWASACGFAYSAFSGTVVIVVGPLAAQALAGRFHLENPLRLLAGGVLIAAAYVGLVPVVLHLALHGGAVVGPGYRRVLDLTLLYAAALPFAIFWQLMTRAEHRDAERWRSLAFQAVLLFVVHSALLGILVALHAWSYIPLATLGGFATMALGNVALRSRAPRTA